MSTFCSTVQILIESFLRSMYVTAPVQFKRHVRKTVQLMEFIIGKKNSFKYLVSVSTVYPAQLTNDSIIQIHFLQDS